MTRPRANHARKARDAFKSTIGVIVEGETEFYALPLLPRLVGCPPLKPTNLRGVGSHMTPAAIAKMVAPKVISHIVAGHSRVVVCIDRESRPECAGLFAQAIFRDLAKELALRGYANHDAHVVIADRTFEAWLLADARGLHQRKHLKTVPKFHSFEGQMGERGLKGVVELSKLLAAC